MQCNLSAESVEEIRSLFPSLPEDWLDLTFPENLAVQMYDLDQGKTIHVSLVCLYDAFRRLEFARDCLFKCFSNLKWYREEDDSVANRSREFFAARQGKFYVDYNFLFLYAIGEDIADFILYFLNKDSEFRNWCLDPKNEKYLVKKSVTSKAARVGTFLIKEYPTHDITRIIKKLKNSPSWKMAMQYRNTWVHDKPPIIDGLGLEYRRQNAIWMDGNAKGFGIGRWSEPDFQIDELSKLALQATSDCYDALLGLLDLLRRKHSEIAERKT